MGSHPPSDIPHPTSPIRHPTSHILSPFLSRGRILLITAAPSEARAVAADLNITPPDRAWQLAPSPRGLDLLMSGISKSNAAGAAARFLNPSTHSAVLSIGIAGSLPGSNLALGSVILASASVFADEGLQSPDGFQDTTAMGFPLVEQASQPAMQNQVGRAFQPAFPCDPLLLTSLTPAANLIAPIATVSTCSGTDALAAEVAHRTSAAAEAMEGAAIALIAHRLNIPFAELRTISNTTGNRPSQHWDLPAALTALTRVVEML